jgi:predicted transcriptional regulator
MENKSNIGEVRHRYLWVVLIEAVILDNGKSDSGSRQIFLVMIIIFVLILTFVSVSSSSLAAPEVSHNDMGGSWSDTFGDLTGIEFWKNLKLLNGDIDLTNLTIFSDDFNGADGEVPNSTKWIGITSGGLVELENNQLKAFSPTDDGLWHMELIESKYKLEVDHIITWRQQLYVTDGDGMFYHFLILNGENDSRLFGNNQNHANEYHWINFVTGDYNNISSFVSGWHDYKVLFKQGNIEFYFDGVLEYSYNFGVESVKYQFGNYQVNESGTIYTDDVLVKQMDGEITSTEIVLPLGNTWDTVEINKSELSGNIIKISVLDGVSNQPIAGFEDLSGANIDISTIDHIVHPSLRLRAYFSGYEGQSPILHDWKVTWLDAIAPEIPSGFNIINPLTGYSLILSWDSNMEADFDHYVLYYSTDNISFDHLVNLYEGTLSFTHYGLTTGVEYYYKIAAADKVPNQSPFSDVIFGIPDLDMDNDTIGDSQDPDIDGDGIPNELDEFPEDPLEWVDTDLDGIGNNRDLDDDGDGYDDVIDDFPLNPFEYNDLDGDGIGDNADSDIDGDGYNNTVDVFDANPNEWKDSDSDGFGDNMDSDDDNDGFGDVIDAFIFNPLEWLDTDSDGIGNNEDEDDDNDGFSDEHEIFKGTDPLDHLSFPREEKREDEILNEDTARGAALGIAAGVAVGGLIISSEVILYSLLSLFAPLLIRVRRKNLLENEVRSMIRTYIRLHPGTHYSSIKSNLGLPNGSLIYHLNKLEKKEIVYSKREGRYKRFYPKGIAPNSKPIITEFQENLLESINETPGVSKAELAYIFERNRQDINHNVNVLLEKELVIVKKENGKTHIYINDKNLDGIGFEEYDEDLNYLEHDMKGSEEISQDVEKDQDNEQEET